MDANTKWYDDKRLERTKEALIRNNYEVYIAENKEEAKEIVKKIVPEDSCVSFGGSMTLSETGILDLLRSGNYRLLDRQKEGLTKDELLKLHRDSFFADYYFASTNALTENGELVNLDGNGNRAAAMMFGPDKVVIVAGINKITGNIEEAADRVRSTASPINCRRLSKKTPCTEKGYCMDCSSPERICNHFVITYRQNIKGRGIVILINENYGY